MWNGGGLSLSGRQDSCWGSRNPTKTLAFLCQDMDWSHWWSAAWQLPRLLLSASHYRRLQHSAWRSVGGVPRSDAESCDRLIKLMSLIVYDSIDEAWDQLHKWLCKSDAISHIVMDWARTGLVLAFRFSEALTADVHAVSFMKVGWSAYHQAHCHFLTLVIMRVSLVLPAIGLCRDEHLVRFPSSIIIFTFIWIDDHQKQW